MRIEIIGGIEVTPDFWDCECESSYIHPRAEAVCPKCGADREDQPDSRVGEVQHQHQTT